MKKTDGRLFQMTVTLKGIRRPIWRRVQVAGGIRLSDFHDAIQTAFGWTDSHLHEFCIGGRTYGQPDDFDVDIENESAITLARAVGTVRRFLYVYDFGDDWQHDVVVEKIVHGNSASERPLCLGGRRHRPPEDCGGPRGYKDFLAAIQDPAHEEHEAMLEWVGGSFDPEAFDIAGVNRALIALSAGRGRVQ